MKAIRAKQASRMLQFLASTAAFSVFAGCGERSDVQSGRSSSNVVSSDSESQSDDSIAKSQVQNNCVALSPEEICLGTVVDAGGRCDAAPGINSCLNAENTTLALPPGRYLIKSTINILHDGITFSTQGLSGDPTTCLKNETSKRCAVLLAADDFGEPKPDKSFAEAMLWIGSNKKPVNRVTLDHIALDGAKDARSKNGNITKNCGPGKKGGRNLMEAGGKANRLLYSASVNALCGTAVGWAVAKTGSESEIMNNFVANNGIGYPHNTIWSDGLTIGKVSNATIKGNLFQDSTDVDVVIGVATDTTFSNNIIYHESLNAFAGFMLTNWSLRQEADPDWNCDRKQIGKDRGPLCPQWADFRGLVVSDNTFRCNYLVQICVQIGIFPWFYPKTGWDSWRTTGGTFRNNEIYTQNQGINVGGGGTKIFPVILDGNKINKTGAASAEIGAGSNRTSRRVGKLNVVRLGAENFIEYRNGQGADVDQADPWHSIF